MREDQVAVAEALDAATTFVVRRLSATGEVSATAATTLSTLSRSGPSRITDLAYEKGISQPSMTALVSRLRRQGFIEREVDPSDGRSARISITQQGRDLLARRREARVELLCDLVSRLGEAEQHALLSAVPALRQMTGEDAPAAAAVPETSREVIG